MLTKMADCPASEYSAQVVAAEVSETKVKMTSQRGRPAKGQPRCEEVFFYKNETTDITYRPNGEFIHVLSSMFVV